jgi:hypothetical protein
MAGALVSVQPDLAIRRSRNYNRDLTGWARYEFLELCEQRAALGDPISQLLFDLGPNNALYDTARVRVRMLATNQVKAHLTAGAAKLGFSDQDLNRLSVRDFTVVLNLALDSISARLIDDGTKTIDELMSEIEELHSRKLSKCFS